MEAQSDAGDCDREVRELPAVERQAFDLGDVHDATHRGIGCLHARQLGHDVHDFGHAGQRQLDIEVGRLRDVDRDVFPGIRREAGELGVELVDADRQRREAVDAFAVGHVGADETGLGAARGNRDTR